MTPAFKLLEPLADFEPGKCPFCGGAQLGPLPGIYLHDQSCSLVAALAEAERKRGRQCS